jgi:hypothetical protein
MSQELQTNALHKLGLACLALPNPDMDLRHLFAPDSYARMLIMPANTVVMGAVHKKQSITACCYGLADVVDQDGHKQRIYGPHFWITEPGTQRAFYVIEETCLIGFFVGEFKSVLDAETQLVDLPSFCGVQNNEVI